MMKGICPICNKEFELTKSQIKNMKSKHSKNAYCSKECRYKALSRKLSKEYPSVICPICNKEFNFKSNKYACKYFSSPTEYKSCCSEKCKQEYLKRNKIKSNENQKELNRLYYIKNKDMIGKERKQYYQENKDRIIEKSRQYYQENKDKIKNQNKEYYEKNKIKIQQENSYKYKNKDFAPHQNDQSNLDRSDKIRFVNERVAAVPKANKSQFGKRTSKRKGVCKVNIKGTIYYRSYLNIKSKSFYKLFKTESEAIAYRIYLENTYYTPEQLAIRDKYNTIDY